MMRNLFALTLILFMMCRASAAPGDAQLVPFVNARLRAWQPSAEERRFDEIGWVTSIGEAMHLAAQQQRPIFYFTHDGRMALGRC